MADITELLAGLAALTDDEVRVVVQEATASRPGLAALHAAAGNVVPGPGVPTTPDLPGTPEVLPPVTFGPVFSSLDGVGSGYTASGVPTFDSVREKVEQRAGRAIGSEELERESAHGKTAAEQFAKREQAGKDRLAEIRKSLGLQDKGQSAE
jgi:hypothetical protein